MASCLGNNQCRMGTPILDTWLRLPELLVDKRSALEFCKEGLPCEPHSWLVLADFGGARQAVGALLKELSSPAPSQVCGLAARADSGALGWDNDVAAGQS